MHLDEATRLMFTARKGWLDLAPKVLDIIMAQQEIGQRIGIGCYIEGFCTADASQRTRCHITD